MNIPCNISPLGWKSLLPAGYTRLEFLQSTGTQWVDTGIVPTAETGLLLDNELTKQDDTIPFGCRNSSGTDTRFYAVRAPREAGGDGSLWMGYGWGAWTAFQYVGANRRFLTRLNWRCSAKAEVPGFDYFLPTLRFEPFYTLYLFAANIGSTPALGFKGRIWRAGISEGDRIVREYIPALDPTGIPCLSDLVSKQALKNNGTGQFISGIKDTAQLRTVLRKLPATGGELKLSLPAEANTPKVAEQLQACHDTKGWTLTVYEYRPAEAATYSLRRVREVVWCSPSPCEHGSYVDNFGTRWQIDRCAAIFGEHGQDPTAYGYTPFDSVEQAAEQWELTLYQDPETEEEQ